MEQLLPEEGCSIGNTNEKRFRLVEIILSIHGDAKVFACQSIFPVHCGCPHSHEISDPVLTVSQWGLQYLLSLAAKQLQPVCPHRFLFLSSISNPFYLDFLPSPFDLIEHLLYVGLQVTETLFTFVSEGGRDLSPGPGSFAGL
jgi:hypothetical protein